MAITHEDMQEIKRVLDDYFVKIVDCDNKQTSISNKLANDDKRIELMLLKQEATNQMLKRNNWLTTAILTVIIGIVLTMILKSVGVF